ncbi:MAG: hypothetical protein ACI959_000665 [Limisphaerales bacterium]|jgi:hypothetical protein
MSYELTGRLIEKFDIEQPTASFRKREFVVELAAERSGRKFFDPVKFQLTQDRVDLIDAYELNETLKVTFDIKGNRWERDDRVSYFTNLVAWKIEREGAESTGSTDTGASTPPPMPPAADASEDDELDDLPF